ncbi:AEC family transporter [Saccharospirillum impatiens]|uniref:AEC family transporter n=1 Tax=Saccharospirillum impatiens TaxID=169438 RepID=UPI00041FD6B9|nr:AEC family transporter [Saccharospirillum impatiens]
MLLAYVNALIPVLFCAALGYGLARKTGLLNSPSLATLVTHIGLPTLILNALLTMDADLLSLSGTLWAIVAVLVISALFGAVVLHLSGLPIRGYLPMLVNPNTGNLGIPLVFALLGPEALIHAVVISTVVQISHFTLGVGLLSGRFSITSILRNGSILALIAGVIWRLVDAPRPEAVMSTLSLLSGMTLPIMLLLLGKSLASIDVRRLDRLGRIVGLSFARVTIGLTAALLVCLALPLSPLVQQTLLLQASMPVAVISYLLASHYNGPKDDIAAIILVSLPISLLAVLGIQLLS